MVVRDGNSAIIIKHPRSVDIRSASMARPSVVPCQTDSSSSSSGMMSSIIGDDEDEAVAVFEIDETSRDGHFGWEKFANFHFPFISRHDKKYCSRRMIESTLSDRLQPEAMEIVSNKAVGATVAEAHLLNVINVHHCQCSYGSELFIVGDQLLELNDVRLLVEFLNDCYKLCCGGAESDDNKCGLIRINKDVVVPYIKIGGNKHVPLFYFKNATGVDLDPSKLEKKKMNVWDHCYVKFCCRIIGKISEDFYMKEDYFVDLLNVTPYLSFYAEVEEFWPQEFVYCSQPRVQAIIKDEHPVEVVEKPSEECNKPCEVRQKRRYVRRNKQIQNFISCKENDMPNESEKCDSGIDSLNSSLVKNSSETDDTMTENVRAVKLKRMREIAKQQRLNETPEQREKRLMRLRLYQAKRLANETPEQRERRLAKLRLYNLSKKMNRHKTKVAV